MLFGASMLPWPPVAPRSSVGWLERLHWSVGERAWEEKRQIDCTPRAGVMRCRLRRRFGRVVGVLRPRKAYLVQTWIPNPPHANTGVLSTRQICRVECGGPKLRKRDGQDCSSARSSQWPIGQDDRERTRPIIATSISFVYFVCLVVL